VNQFTKENKTGLLVVVESHLTAVRHANIQNLFGRRLEIVFSQDPEFPNTKGVAFVINKDLMNTDNIRTWDIDPGRAMLLEIETHGDEKIAILGVYAPNIPSDNADFWKKIREFFEDNPTVPKPDMMAGDMNIVEEALDRLPCHTDSIPATTQLDLLLTLLRMVDGWRKTYPTTRAYTYLQRGADGLISHSRLDRIYIKRDKYADTYDWQITTPGIPTDHKMVSVRLTQDAAPTTGPGHWVWQKHINGDKELSKFIHEKGIQTLTAMERAVAWPIRDRESDPQILWSTYQTDIRDKAREHSKILIPKAEREIACLESDL
ncbi:hypothetical protein B0H12DRAFT_986678, partial [Mycena haematopus]